MSTETLRAIIRFLHDFELNARPVPLVWHAGEPLAVPIRFYEEADRLLTDVASTLPVRQHIQTNATLITDEWCSLFKRSGYCIGVSIDGPQAIHDKYRRDRRGRGTFVKTMAGIRKLQEHEIPFTVLAVITDHSLDAVEEIWSFFRDLGVPHIGFNVEEKEGAHTSSSLTAGQHYEQVRSFWRRLAELEACSRHLKVRELDDMRRHLRAPPGSEVKRANNRPGAIISIDCDGNVTTLSPELLGIQDPAYGRFAWANVNTDTYGDLLNNADLHRAYDDVLKGVAECRSRCPYFRVCGGGNPSNKLAEHGTFATSETQHCRLHVQAVADAMMAHLESGDSMTRRETEGNVDI